MVKGLKSLLSCCLSARRHSQLSEDTGLPATQPLAQQGSSLPLGQQENLPRITEPQGERASVTLLSPTG